MSKVKLSPDHALPIVASLAETLGSVMHWLEIPTHYRPMARAMFAGRNRTKRALRRLAESPSLSSRSRSLLERAFKDIEREVAKMQNEVSSETQSRRVSSAQADAANEVNNLDKAAHALLESIANLRMQLDWFLAKTAVGEEVYIDTGEDTKALALSEHSLSEISDSTHVSTTQLEDPVTISLARWSTEAWKRGGQ